MRRSSGVPSVRSTSIGGALALLVGVVGALWLAVHPLPAGGGNLAFVVDTTADTADADKGNGSCEDAGGDCSLRAAIQEVNAGQFHDIHFGLSACPPTCTISTTSPLPQMLRDDVTIDGTTQPGYVDTAIVTLDGSAQPSQGGLSIGSDNATVKGLIVRDFPSNGIGFFSPGGSILENVVMDNGLDGLRGSGPDMTIADNVISGNGRSGVSASIGDGLVDGLVTRNLITGNEESGMLFAGARAVASENTVSSNGGTGINAGFTDVDQVISGNTVSDNGFKGIHQTGDDAMIADNTVSGNGFEGMTIQGERNVVTGNTVTGNGLVAEAHEDQSGIAAGFATDIIVQGNAVSGNVGDGVVLEDGFGMVVGGTGAGEPNTITGNGGAGVFVLEADVFRIAQPAGDFQVLDSTISANAIYGNGGLGIDIGPAGVTQNDPLDADTGPNRRQNFPVLTEATSGSVNVIGTLNSRPQASIRIEFFANEMCDSSNHGEGQEYVGSTDVSTDIEGNASIDADLDTDVPSGWFITSTATHLGTKDTSEFSACVEVDGETGTPTATPTPTPPDQSPTPTDSSTPTPTPTPTSGPVELVQGDVDCDGDADAVDALKELQDIAALPYGQAQGCPEIGGAVLASAAPTVFGDVDCDGDADAVDALKILQHIAAIPFTQNDPCPDIGDEL